jgi:hypothetical protein
MAASQPPELLAEVRVPERCRATLYKQMVDLARLGLGPATGEYGVLAGRASCFAKRLVPSSLSKTAKALVREVPVSAHWGSASARRWPSAQQSGS